jgi:hypothetical protein
VIDVGVWWTAGGISDVAHAVMEVVLSLGAPTPGADRDVDYAIAKLPAIDRFLRQGRGGDEPGVASAEVADELLVELMADRLAPLHSLPGGSITHGDLTHQEV